MRFLIRFLFLKGRIYTLEEVFGLTKHYVSFYSLKVGYTLKTDRVDIYAVFEEFLFLKGRIYTERHSSFTVGEFLF
ncbi:hypothetical protein [Petrotoga sp. 8T1HF07.NaAc.6.1]|uniref:hypothetical protein n=1 Tax=Petrotoga sp. 8T1HF07.NaAc.6.1 TaxID=1351838 RepID=UPI003FCE7EE4